MKRDLDICRETLRFVNDNGKLQTPLEIKLPQYNEEELSYNVYQLIKANFLKSYTENLEDKIVFGQITWDGHEYLDLILNDTFWNKAKTTIKEKVGTTSFSVILNLLSKLSEQQLDLF